MKHDWCIMKAIWPFSVLGLIYLVMLLMTGCVSGPAMPTEPFRCFDSDGHEIPCVDEMDCHQDETGSVKEQA